MTLFDINKISFVHLYTILYMLRVWLGGIVVACRTSDHLSLVRLPLRSLLGTTVVGANCSHTLQSGP